MTYTEWRDELKSNLLCVSESERRRVLDYYAEAYADRREAGFSEREIIAEFGAPYDAAQRILSENPNGGYFGEPAQSPRGNNRREERQSPPPPPPPPPRPQSAYNGNYYGSSAPNNPYPPSGSAAETTRTDNTWIFVLLCIIFAIPIFWLIMTMVGITIGFCVAPIAVIGGGAAVAGTAIAAIAGGNVAYGFVMIGVGIIILGVGIILCPLFFKLVSLMWTLFRKFFAWLKSLFSGKERI